MKRLPKVIAYPYFLRKAQATANKLTFRLEGRYPYEPKPWNVCDLCKKGGIVSKVYCRMAHPGNEAVAEADNESSFPDFYGPDHQLPSDFLRLCAACSKEISNFAVGVDDVREKTEHLYENIVRRWVRYSGALAFDEPPFPNGLPIEVGMPYRDALRSFLFGQLGAAVVQSSASVECAINLDTRMQKIQPAVKGERRWRNLNRQLLEEALAAGLPIELFLQAGENENGKISVREVQFLKRRNKLAHGEWGAVFGRFYPVIWADIGEPEAFDQLYRAQQFLAKWSASQGGPTLNGSLRGIIVNGEWISVLGVPAVFGASWKPINRTKKPNAEAKPS